MYQIKVVRRFEKDVQNCHKRGYNLELLEYAIEALRTSGNLPQKFKPHKLKGNFIHHWEAHLKPDWLIIWINNEKEKNITLVRTGTHSDLF